MKNEPIFDAHLHILLKSILTGYHMDIGVNGTDPWSNLKIGFPASLMGKTLKSQSNLSQIKDANASLVVHALFSPDYSLIDAGLVDKIGPLIIKDLRKKAIEKLKDNSPKNNLKFELACVDHIKTVIPSGQLGINCLTASSTYDPSKINLVFNIEGAHNFYDQKANGEHFFDQDYLVKLKKNSKYRICFVNLTHVQQWWACTHAYAMKLLDNCLSNKSIRYMFKPSGFGIQEAGFTIMKKLLDKSDGQQQMLVDIKHMSLFSRIQYYAWRRKHFPDAPIVASHVGLTGRSWHYIKLGHYKKFKKRKFKCQRVYHRMDKYRGHLKNTSFYPNTINLCDEEIVEIVKSKGLIGISLDKRILGSQSQEDVDFIEYNDEYMSNEEYHLLLGSKESILRKVGDDDYILNRKQIRLDYGIKPEDDVSIRAEVAKYINTNYIPGVVSKAVVFPEPIEEEEEIILNRQIEHFINTVLHVIVVGGAEAWDCVCLGSDFDGLITPIRKINTVAHLPNLRASTTDYIKNNIDLWTAFNVSSYDDIDAKIRKLFFENGKRFVEENL